MTAKIITVSHRWPVFACRARLVSLGLVRLFDDLSPFVSLLLLISLLLLSRLIRLRLGECHVHSQPSIICSVYPPFSRRSPLVAIVSCLLVPLISTLTYILSDGCAPVQPPWKLGTPVDVFLAYMKVGSKIKCLSRAYGLLVRVA